MEKLFPKTKHSVIIYLMQLQIHISFQLAWKTQKFLFEFSNHRKKLKGSE